MRWDDLFADLEGQLEAGALADEREHEAEEERLRLGRLSLRDRIAAAMHAPGEKTVRIDLVTGDLIGVRPTTLGRDWIAGDLVPSRDGAQVVLPIDAIASIVAAADGLAASLDPSRPGALVDRLGIAFVLRDLARRRRSVEVLLRTGIRCTGTFDRVGRDHADLAVHPEHEARRAGAVQQLRLVPFAQIALVTAR